MSVPVSLSLSLITVAIIGTVLGLIVRRLLGPAIGRPRSIVVGIIVVLTSGAILSTTAKQIGIVTEDGRAVIDDGQMLALLGLACLAAVAVSAVTLFVGEVLVPTGSLSSPRVMVGSMLAMIKRARRIASIMRVASKSGLHRALTSGLGPNDPEFGRSLVTFLGGAGVSFVKLGQFLSTRTDMLPPALTSALSKLQTDASVLPFTQVNAVLAEELGPDWRDSFASVDEKPLAAASIAQVHRGVLTDGTEVVIKVQRPEAAAAIAVDSDILIRLAANLSRRYQWARSMSVSELAHGFVQSLHEELDYSIELRNLELFHSALADLDGVETPPAHPELSTGRVLVTDFVPGPTLGRAAAGGFADIDEDSRSDLARRLCRTTLRTILGTGIFHADLHPGNIILGPESTLVFIDLGSVGVLDDESRTALALILHAVVFDDAATAGDAIVLAFDTPEILDLDRLRRDIGRVITLLTAHGRVDDTMVRALVEVLKDHSIGIPGDLAAAFRTLASIEESVSGLDPDLTLLRYSEEELPRLAAEIVTPRKITAKSVGAAGIAAITARRLSGRIESMSADLANGNFVVRTRLFGSDSERRWVSSVIAEVTAVFLACTAVIASVLLFNVDGGVMLSRSFSLYQALGWVLAFAGTMIALRTVVKIFARR